MHCAKAAIPETNKMERLRKRAFVIPGDESRI